MHFQVLEVKLVDKNRVMIFRTANEIIDLCEEELERNNIENSNCLAQGETLTKAQKPKAIQATYLGVGNINAETVLSQHKNLQILYNLLNNHPDPLSWELPIKNIRPTLNWFGRWCTKDDVTLLVGSFI